MKSLKSLSLVLMLVSATVTTTTHACGDTKKANSSSTESKSFYAPKKSDITVNVKGMMCENCTKAIKHNLNKHEAIKSTTVDLKTGTVQVELEKDKKLSDASLKKIIVDTGYAVEKIKR